MSVIIKTECTYEIGSGHLMRTLSLAQEISRSLDDDILFVLNNTPSNFKKLVESKGYKQTDLTSNNLEDEKIKITKLIKKIKPKLIVTDSYNVDSSYIQTIAGCKQNATLLCISEFDDQSYVGADFVVNHNVYGNELKYKVDENTVVLGGEKYAILRDEFMQKKNRTITDNPKALVTFGGSDAQNLTLKTAQLLYKNNIETNVVVGAMHKYFAEIKKLESNSLKILHNISNIHELMWQADFAFASAGTTTYELLATELPSAFYLIADNQRLICDTIKRRELGIYAGEGSTITTKDIEQTLEQLLKQNVRTAIYDKIKGLVDGKGKQRIIDAVKKKME